MDTTEDAEVAYLRTLPRVEARRILIEKLKEENKQDRLAKKLGFQPYYGLGLRARVMAKSLKINI